MSCIEGDTTGDKVYTPDSEQFIIWAVGRLGDQALVTKHSRTLRGKIPCCYTNTSLLLLDSSFLRILRWGGVVWYRLPHVPSNDGRPATKSEQRKPKVFLFDCHVLLCCQIQVTKRSSSAAQGKTNADPCEQARWRSPKWNLGPTSRC